MRAFPPNDFAMKISFEAAKDLRRLGWRFESVTEYVWGYACCGVTRGPDWMWRRIFGAQP